MANDPMIKLDPGGKATILSYNVPEPTSYSGRNLIELALDASYFKPEASQVPPRLLPSQIDLGTLVDRVAQALASGYYDPQLFPNIRIRNNALAIRAVDRVSQTAGAALVGAAPGMGNSTLTAVGQPLPVRNLMARIDPQVVAQRMMAGERLNIFRNLHGTYDYNFIPEPVKARPRIMLVETYRLSSFSSSYGAGRVIKTFSLLPGEKTHISVKTYTKTETEASQSSSIFDSFSEESSNEFESAVQNEQTDKRAQAESFEYHAEADAHASWGFGSANISGGVKGGSNASREQFSRNVSNAARRHAEAASAKRDININTSYESKVSTGEETSIEREIQNVNVGRTLNFIFRQMNQEYISLLHLVDVSVAFFNGYAESRMEVPLYDLDSLLNTIIVNAKTAEVRQLIVNELATIFDYDDSVQSFVEERQLIGANNKPSADHSYLRVRKDLTSTYKDDVTGAAFSVPGIILAANKVVLRTEGVIVETLLGQGDGLDDYSHGLQDETVRERQLTNDERDAEVKLDLLRQKVISSKDSAEAALFPQVFPQPKVEEDGCDGNGNHGHN
jgi:hypothetical protein